MNIRKAAVAGSFYPAKANALRDAVTTYIDNAEVESEGARVASIIAPHAGYQYSGETAGYVYRRVRNKIPKRVVILARSHRMYFEGATIWCEGAWETPLGQLPVDEAFAKSLQEECDTDDSSPHMEEHAIEVQLPFLQVALGEVPIVPVLFGSDPSLWHLNFGERLAELCAPDDLVIASTDLSHFLDEEQANSIDTYSLQCVMEQHPGRLMQELDMGNASMCGGTAVISTMAYAKARKALDWHLLDYRTSALASGDYQRVVGYGAISMEAPN